MEHLDLKRWGEDLSRLVWQAVRMPVSIGIAPTKTLAKMAFHFAKHYPGYNRCCYIDGDEKRIKALSLYDAERHEKMKQLDQARMRYLTVMQQNDKRMCRAHPLVDSSERIFTSRRRRNESRG